MGNSLHVLCNAIDSDCKSLFTCLESCSLDSQTICWNMIYLIHYSRPTARAFTIDSVETLLMNVSSFILREMDSGSVTASVLLDLSGLRHCRPQNTCQYCCKSAYPGQSSRMVEIISSMPFTVCPFEWFHILVKAIRLWSTPRICGRAHLIFNLFKWSPKYFSTSFCSLSFICIWYTHFCIVSAESNSSFPSLAQFRKMHRRYRRLDEGNFFAVKPQ